MSLEDPDILMRKAAFDHVRLLSELHERLTWKQFEPGFFFEGNRIPLVNPQRGIFKPRKMRFLLSIKTVIPRPKGKIWYEDQIRAHVQVFKSDETLDYAFMGDNPNDADNQWLKEAYENQIPIIYFLGVAPGLYRALFPAFIAGWDPNGLKAQVVFGTQEHGGIISPYPESLPVRRYALQLTQRRLHQDVFRQAVITAYRGRCAISGLPEPLLLDAAHIISDKDEKLGQPIVPNGLPLSKIHHAAFDAHLIGIDADYKLHVSKRLLEKRDGPMLESLKQLENSKLRAPPREKDCPDRERLALRFEQFEKAA